MERTFLIFFLSGTWGLYTGLLLSSALLYSCLMVPSTDSTSTSHNTGMVLFWPGSGKIPFPA